MQDGHPGHIPAASWDHQGHKCKEKGGLCPPAMKGSTVAHN